MDKEKNVKKCSKCDTAMKMDESNHPACDKKACDK